jgi:cytochrome d ubiquinol oxidase subunit II
MSGIGLPELVAGVMMLALNAYVLTGGADFGGGVWDLLARGPRAEAHRALIARAIGPIWEANHVWLIIVIVILFTAFPAAFAVLGTVAHVPLTLMLIGIVLRGSAFVFRSYGPHDDAVQHRWGRLFAMASTITPVLLGMIVGAVASGRLGEAARVLSALRTALDSGASPPTFSSVYVWPWMTPFAAAVGVMALSLFAFLAAVYLAVAAGDDRLREDFRRRALATAGAVFVAAFGALALARVNAPRVSTGLLSAAWSVPLQVATAVAAIAAVWALWRRRWAIARVAATAQVSLILWGWALLQYPSLVPPALTIRSAAAPDVTLRLLLIALAVGALVLIPSLAYLLRVQGVRVGDRDQRI